MIVATIYRPDGSYVTKVNHKVDAFFSEDFVIKSLLDDLSEFLQKGYRVKIKGVIYSN